MLTKTKFKELSEQIRRIDEDDDDWDEDDFTRKMNKARDMADQYGFNHSIWSMYEVIDDMDRHPFPDRTGKLLVYKDHWGEETVAIRIGGTATWIDIWRAADQAIKESGDSHHQFIEGFYRIEFQDEPALELQTGS